MATLSSISCLFLLLCLLGASFARKQDLLIKTKSGRVRGKVLKVLDGEVRAFLGIPYAQPPVGKLRFRHPQPAPPWRGVKTATTYSNSCFQLRDTQFPGRITKEIITMCITHSLHELNKEIKLNPGFTEMFILPKSTFEK